MEKNDPIAEARRYVANAKTILREKAGKDGNYYTDSKYIRMAGHTLWTGCLLALDYALNIPTKDKQRRDIKDYQEAAGRRSKKLSTLLKNGYDIMTCT